MDEKTFGVDAHIPADTEKFDKKVVEMRAKQIKLTPEREKLNMEFSLLASRLSSYANFYLANEENGLGAKSMWIQDNAQSTVTSCSVQALTEMLQEKLLALSRCFTETANVYWDEIHGVRPSKVDVLPKFLETCAKALVTSETELFQRTIKNIENHLKALQDEFHIVITAQGVTVEKPEPAPTSKPGPNDQQAPA